jgi:hypothetical protein
MKKISSPIKNVPIPEREKEILSTMYDLEHAKQLNHKKSRFNYNGVEYKCVQVIGENRRIGGEKTILASKVVGDLIKPKYWNKVMELKLMKRKNHKNFEYLEFVDKIVVKEDKGAWID